MKKRITSLVCLILCVIMVLGTLPVSAATLTYQASPVQGGSVSNEEEEIDDYAIYEPVQGSKATAKDGYTFDGWYRDDDFLTDTAEFKPEPEQYQPDPYSSGHYLWVTALYEARFSPISYTVKFDANGGEGTMADMSFTYDEEQNLTDNSFTRDGYTFAGWATETDGQTVYTDGQEVVNLTSDDDGTVTLYAVWNEKTAVTVTYTAGENGAVDTASEALNPDTGVANGSTASANEGYKFVNWTADGQEVSTDKAFVPQKPADGWAEITYTANFAPISYTVKFDANGGEGTMADMSFTYDVKQNLTDNSFTRDGYTFAGWATEVDGQTVYTDGQEVVNLTSDDDGTVTLYAVWSEVQTATVTFRIIHGKWADGTREDKTVTVYLTQGKGTLGIDNVPVDMRADNGYTVAEGWDKAPEYEENLITDDVTYTYTFRKPIKIVLTDGGEPVNDRNLLKKTEHVKYINGYHDSTLRPDSDMTRAEASQMFYNLLKESEKVEISKSFEDVTEDMWHYTAVGVLSSLGIINGYDDNKFMPDRAITRGEFIAAAVRFMDGSPSGKNTFDDISEDDWYYEYIVGAANLGWIDGYPDGTFRPEDTITRAEAVVVINRMLERSPDKHFIDRYESKLVTFDDVTRDHWAYYQIMEAINYHKYSMIKGEEKWTAFN
ncbi:MAG: hypothetical protein E7588_09335 [Ruminococcaceae bacterium]|nr:hypothetical protein [Oscillospiraceae bacterium]